MENILTNNDKSLMIEILRNRNEKMYSFLIDNIDINALLESCIKSNVISAGLTIAEDNDKFVYYRISDRCTIEDIRTNYLNDTFQTSYGISAKIGKFLGKHLSLKDDVLKSIVDRYKKEFAPVELTIGTSSFEDAYQESNYQGEFTSCMWGEDVSDFYDNYDCKCLTLQDDSYNLYGRAILWESAKVETKEGVIFKTSFLDRIYVVSPEYESYFQEYAIKNGIAYKTRQSSSCCSIIYQSREITPVQMSVEQCECTYLVSFYPYLDTFRYMSSSGLFSVWDSRNTVGELRRTDGEIDLSEGYALIDREITNVSDMIEINGQWYQQKEVERCSCCDCYIREHDTTFDVHGNVVCCSCLDDFVYIDNSNVEKGYYPTNELEYNDIMKEYVIKDGAIWSEYHEMYFYKIDLIYEKILNDYIHNGIETISVNIKALFDVQTCFVMADKIQEYIEKRKIIYCDNEYWLNR